MRYLLVKTHPNLALYNSRKIVEKRIFVSELLSKKVKHYAYIITDSPTRQGSERRKKQSKNSGGTQLPDPLYRDRHHHRLTERVEKRPDRQT